MYKKRILLLAMACGVLFGLVLGCTKENDDKDDILTKSVQPSEEDLAPSSTVMPELLPDENEQKPFSSQASTAIPKSSEEAQASNLAGIEK